MGFYLELMETSNRAYQLGSCIVNPLENKLICNGCEQLLQPKFIELLACLVARYPEQSPVKSSSTMYGRAIFTWVKKP